MYTSMVTTFSANVYTQMMVKVKNPEGKWVIKSKKNPQIIHTVPKLKSKCILNLSGNCKYSHFRVSRKNVRQEIISDRTDKRIQ